MLYAGEALSSVERNLEPKTYNLKRRTVREPRPPIMIARALSLPQNRVQIARL